MTKKAARATDHAILSRTRSPAFAALALLLVAAFLSCGTAPEPQAAAPVEQTPEPPATLASLIAAGDQEGIKTFFSNQEQLNAPDAKGSYPLHNAVERESVQTVEMLLALGARIESKDAQGRSPLRLAVDRGGADCARVLAERGADLFSVDATGTTAAEAALAKGGDIVAAVFNAATVNAKGADGRTPLHIACDRLLENAASRLLEAGADPNARDKAGAYPLDLVFLHPDRIEAARIAESLAQRGAASTLPEFSWFVQAAKAVDYGSVRYEDGATPLHQATSRRQKGFLQFLLARKANPNIRDGSGAAPLHEAVRSGWLEGAELLLKGGADPNVLDGFKNSPLHIALPEEGRDAGVALLLRYGADPSLKDLNGNTPLHVAVQVGYPVSMIQALIDAQAPVNAANSAGDTPLHVSLRAKRYELAGALIRGGADLYLVNGRNESPLSVAVESGIEALEVTVTESNVKARDNFGNGPLAIAVGLKAPPDAVALLIAKGADVNARNNAGDSALHVAVRSGLRAQGEALLLAKADIFSANVRGESPLSLALTARGGPADWLFTPASIVSRDSNGDTPLHHAARRNLAETLDFLLSKGAALDAQNSAGESPLHVAAMADSAEAARRLMAIGAPAAARNSMGDTALHSAVLWGARKTLPVLVAAGADLNARNSAGETPLHKAMVKKDRESLKYLLERGADVDAQDNRGLSPLAAAVRSGALDIAKDLLAAGAKPGIRDLGGRIPLYSAVDAADVEMTKLLVGAGSDILARDGEGASPFSLALRRGPALLSALLTAQNARRSDPDGRTLVRLAVDARPSAEALDLVIASGSDIGACDRFAATALHAALRLGDKESASKLARAGADCFARDKDGETPASLAMTAGVDAFKALVAAAGVASRDKLGNGWLHYAAVAGNVEAAKIAIAAGADKSVKNAMGEIAADVAAKRGKADLAALLKP